MSLTQWFTRSAPTVSCLFSANAIFNFVPTPSMLATSTGSCIPEKLARNKPPKPPIFPKTCGPCVWLTSDWIRRLSLLPRSTSTPARAYAFFIGGGTRAVASASFQIREQRRMPFLLDQRFGAGFAFFHDELVKCGIDGQGIVTGKTGETEFIHRSACRAHHSFDVEIAEAVDAEIFADFFHRHLIRDQLLRIGKINSVMAGEPVRRTAHPHMHFLGAGLAQVYHASAAGRAAQNCMVDHDDAFPGDHF